MASPTTTIESAIAAYKAWVTQEGLAPPNARLEQLPNEAITSVLLWLILSGGEITVNPDGSTTTTVRARDFEPISSTEMIATPAAGGVADALTPEADAVRCRIECVAGGLKYAFKVGDVEPTLSLVRIEGEAFELESKTQIAAFRFASDGATPGSIAVQQFKLEQTA